MTKWDMVKFVEPVDVYEEYERFVVLEGRGDRVLVGSLFIDLIFGATTVLKANDLTLALPYEEGREAGLADSGKTGLFLTRSPYPAGTQERIEWSRGYHEVAGQHSPALLLQKE
jgi:hypothetical protein